MKNGQLETGLVSIQEDMEKDKQGGKLTLAQVRAKLAGQTGKRYWRSIDELAGTPTAESVSCTTTNPTPGGGSEEASLHLIPAANALVSYAAVSDAQGGTLGAQPVSYTKFTSQEALGGFLAQHYKIRTPRELSSCEVCHR